MIHSLHTLSVTTSHTIHNKNVTLSVIPANNPLDVHRSPTINPLNAHIHLSCEFFLLSYSVIPTHKCYLKTHSCSPIFGRCDEPYLSYAEQA